MVIAGYMVNPDYQDHPDHMSHDIVNPAVYKTLGDVMDGKPKVQFKVPENRKIAVGDQKSIPEVTCDPLDSARNRLKDAGFDVSVGSPIDSDCPPGTAAETNPSGRTIKGGVVVISPSNGKKQQPQLPTIPGFPNPRPTKPRR